MTPTRLGLFNRIAIAAAWLLATAGLLLMVSQAIAIALAFIIPTWVAVALAFRRASSRRLVLAWVAVPILMILFVSWPILLLLALGTGLVEMH